MATNIRLRRSDNPGSVPQALLFGEVAINYNDGKLFYKNTSNEIVAVKLIRDIVGQSNQIGVTESNGVFSLSLTNTVNIDTLNLSRLFVDNIEIDTTSSQIDQILQFNGTKYVPVNPNTITISLNDLSDVIISSPISGQKLFYNGSSWVNEIESTGEPIGHTNKAQSLMSFDKTTRTFSISPVATSFEVWCAGKRFTYTSMQSVQIPSFSGLYYIYFNSNGVLSQKTTFFTWDQDSPTAYIYWNSDDGEAYFFADERHGITLDWQTHEYLHRTRGAAYASGFSIGAYTITGTGSANADMQLDIADGTFFDEDLQVDITHSASPPANTWQQVLQGGAEIPIFYRSGSVWKRTTPTKYPLKQGTLAQYNLNTAGTWSTPDLATNKYGVTWIVATNNLNYPVIGIMGQNQYDNLNKVAEDTWAALDLANLPIFEIRPLWKVSYLVSSGFTNTPKAAIREVVDLRVVGSTATGLPVTPTDHGSLYGLSDDDHTQYFNQTRGDTRYLQLTGGTVTGTVAATTFSGSGASLTNLPAASLTGTVNTARLSGAYTGITSVGTLTGGSTWSTAGWVPSLRATSAILLEPGGANTQRWLIGNAGDGNLYIGRNTASDGSQAADYRMYFVNNGPAVINPTLTVSGGSISLNNATSNTVLFSNVGVAPPTFTTRSAGTRLVFWGAVNPGVEVDYAIGIDGGTQWFSVPTTSQQFKWYGGTTNIATLSGSGTLTVGGSAVISGNHIQIAGTTPTLVMTSTDAERSGMIHVNSNLMYFLGGAQNAGMNGWDQNGTGQWPLYLNLTNNYATFGGGASFVGAITLAFNGAVIGAAGGTYRTRISGGSGYADKYVEIGEYYNTGAGHGGIWSGGNLHIGAGGNIKLRGGSGNPNDIATVIDSNGGISVGLGAANQPSANLTVLSGDVIASVVLTGTTAYTGGQVRAYKNSGSLGLGATNDWYYSATFYATPGDLGDGNQTSKTASIAFHPGGVAPQLRVGHANPQTYVRGADGASNYPLTASAFNVASTRRIKTNIQTWPSPSLSAASASAIATVDSLRVVTFDRDEPGHGRLLPTGRRLEALKRLLDYQSRTNRPHYKPPVHDCSTPECDGSPENPCAFKLNSDHREYGLIAEEVFEVIPEAVVLDDEGIPQSINYSMMTAVALAAIQELAAKITELEARQ